MSPSPLESIWRYYLRQEPGAVVPHAGICAGGTRQLVFLPRQTSVERSGLVNNGVTDRAPLIFLLIEITGNAKVFLFEEYPVDADPVIG